MNKGTSTFARCAQLYSRGDSSGSLDIVLNPPRNELVCLLRREDPGLLWPQQVGDDSSHLSSRIFEKVRYEYILFSSLRTPKKFVFVFISSSFFMFTFECFRSTSSLQIFCHTPSSSCQHLQCVHTLRCLCCTWTCPHHGSLSCT